MRFKEFVKCLIAYDRWKIKPEMFKVRSLKRAASVCEIVHVVFTVWPRVGIYM